MHIWQKLRYMTPKIHLTFCAIAFSLFSSVAYSQPDTTKKVFTLKGFKLGESCTSVSEKLRNAVQSQDNELFKAEIHIQYMERTCPVNYPTTLNGKLVNWYVAFGPKTEFGNSSLNFTFSPEMRLISLSLHQSWPDLYAAPLLDRVYKQLTVRFGRPYFVVAFEQHSKGNTLGPFNQAYWSSNMLNPSKTTIQNPYNLDCIIWPVKVKRTECGLDVIQRLSDELNKAKAAAHGVLATAILSPFEGVPMRTKVLHLKIVDVAVMAAVIPSDAERDQAMRDHFKKLEDMKLPKF